MAKIFLISYLTNYRSTWTLHAVVSDFLITPYSISSQDTHTIINLIYLVLNERIKCSRYSLMAEFHFKRLFDVYANFHNKQQKLQLKYGSNVQLGTRTLFL